jgi:tetratricopeptide (TPR) repeat protein
MSQESEISSDELELIDQYLRNELSPEQTGAFNEKMRVDKEWMKKVEDTRLLVLGIQEASLAKRIDGFHEEFNSENEQAPKGKIFRLNIRWAVAASVLIVASVLAGLLLTKKDEYEKLYSSYYTPDPGLLTAMGSSDNYSFDQGMVDYKNGDYKKAIHAWNILLRAKPASDTLHYFLGVANQALDNETDAKKHLEYIVKDSAHSFYSDACWYLGLLLLKQKQPQIALPYIRRSGHPGKAALLDAINNNE